MQKLHLFIFFAIIFCNQYIVPSEKNNFLKCFVCENKSNPIQENLSHKMTIPATHPTFPKKKYVAASHSWLQSLSQKMENRSSNDGLLKISKKNRLYAVKRNNGDITVYQAHYIETPIDNKSEKIAGAISANKLLFDFMRMGKVCEVIACQEREAAVFDTKQDIQINSVWYFTITQTALNSINNN